MKLLNKIIIGTVAALLLLLTIAGSVNAYTYTYGDYAPINPAYHYYGGYDGIPTVAGPYPRYYLGYNDYRGTAWETFQHDDFNNFDSYVGYRDLDVFYPGRGYVDVLRNPQADITPMSVPDQVYRFAEEYHVYGMIPGDAIYRKHYYHDHAWDLSYDYNSWCPTWFQPVVAYIKKPVFKKNCFSQTNCQNSVCACS